MPHYRAHDARLDVYVTDVYVIDVYVTLSFTLYVCVRERKREDGRGGGGGVRGGECGLRMESLEQMHKYLPQMHKYVPEMHKYCECGVDAGVSRVRCTSICLRCT